MATKLGALRFSAGLLLIAGAALLVFGQDLYLRHIAGR
ncbi:hypothetical protein BH11MYX2_BH11MYX2_40550 [soil metagenome]